MNVARNNTSWNGFSFIRTSQNGFLVKSDTVGIRRFRNLVSLIIGHVDYNLFSQLFFLFSFSSFSYLDYKLYYIFRGGFGNNN